MDMWVDLRYDWMGDYVQDINHSTTIETKTSHTIKIKIESLNWYIHPVHKHENGKVAVSRRVANLREPSLNLLPQFHGTRRPSLSFCISTTGFSIPGTAAEASSALQMTVSGAVT